MPEDIDQNDVQDRTIGQLLRAPGNRATSVAHGTLSPHARLLVHGGDPRPNARLKLLRVERCYDLPDLNAFESTTGLEQIQVISCPQLTGPLSMLVSNPDCYRYFKDAGEFPERTILQP